VRFFILYLFAFKENHGDKLVTVDQRKPASTIKSAGESISRILCASLSLAPTCVGISIARRDDHSSRSRIAPGLEQPTRESQQVAPSSCLHTGWASPPLLFGLAPRGVFRAPDVATRAVGSYPTFSPLPNGLRRNRQGCGFPQACRRGDSITGGLIFCGTFRSRVLFACLRKLRNATPWRYQARRPVVRHSCELRTMGVRTFLPCVPFARNTPAIIRLTRWIYYTSESRGSGAGCTTDSATVLADGGGKKRNRVKPATDHKRMESQRELEAGNDPPRMNML
jgi:hypothetical protein